MRITRTSGRTSTSRPQSQAVVAILTGVALTLLRASSAGADLVFTTLTVPVAGGPISLTTGDFNSDGAIDLAVANEGSGNVTILLWTGGSFQPAPGSPFAVGSNPSTIVSGFFNQDAAVDLAVTNRNSNDVSVLLGDGAGGFTSAPNSPYSVGAGPSSLTTASFNPGTPSQPWLPHDDYADLAVTNSFSGNVTFLLGHGSAAFTSLLTRTVGMEPESITNGDFNGDGFVDVAVSNAGSDNVSVLLGDGTGHFSQAANFPAGDRPTSIITGDFNSNGRLDLAVANRDSDNVSVLLGDGTGKFSQAVNSPVGHKPLSIAKGDFDADGRADLAVANLVSNTVSILLGLPADGSPGTFASAIDFPVGNQPTEVTAADFNGDGAMDLAVANRGSENVSILLSSPGALLNPTNLVFDGLQVGSPSLAQSVVLTNNGVVPLTIATITLTGTDPGDFEITSNNCGSIIAPGESCNIGVQFIPTDTGDRSASLTFGDTASTSPQSVLLTGTGIGAADLAISKGAVPSPVHTGSTLTYKITVKNAGPHSARNVRVSDWLPHHSEFVSASATQGSCLTPASGATGVMTCSLGSIASGSSAAISIVVRITAPARTTVENMVEVTSVTFDTDIVNNSATLAVSVT